MRINHSSSSALAALTTLLSACGGGDKAPTNPGGTTGTLTSITITASTFTVPTGSTIRLTAVPKDQNGNLIGATISWSSSNNAVASVTPNDGLVTANADGTARITASSGSVSGFVDLTVSGTATFPLNADVTMPGLSFAPFQSDIAVTGRINFIFPAEAHNVVFDPMTGAPLDIPASTSNATVSRQFGTRGTFRYTCTIHAGMNGVVVVH